MCSRLLLDCVLVVSTVAGSFAQSADGVSLAIYPQRVPRIPDQRLLPADPELKPGNAAVVLLRMIWEQQRFMQETLPQLDELAELPYHDPRVLDGFSFGSFSGRCVEPGTFATLSGITRWTRSR